MWRLTGWSWSLRWSLWLNFWIESCLVCNHPGSVRITLTKDTNLYRRMPAHPSDITRDGNIPRSYGLKPIYWKLLWLLLSSAGQLGAWNTPKPECLKVCWCFLCCPETLYASELYKQFWGCFEITLGWVFFPTLARPHMSAALSSKSSPVTAALDSAAGFKELPLHYRPIVKQAVSNCWWYRNGSDLQTRNDYHLDPTQGHTIWNSLTIIPLIFPPPTSSFRRVWSDIWF